MVTTYYLSSPPRHPRTTKVTLRLPARAWNAYLPLPSAHSPSSPKRCNYRPGNGSFRYGARAITYVQPCLQPSCANCRRWYPRLIDEALPWHPEQKRASITRIAALLDGTSNSDNEMEECTDREEELDVDSTVGKYEPAIPRVVIARSSVRAGIYDTGIPAQYTVRLRYRSVGSKLHYEKVLLEQRRRCEGGEGRRLRGILKMGEARGGVTGVGKKVRFERRVKRAFPSEVGGRFAALLRERF